MNKKNVNSFADNDFWKYKFRSDSKMKQSDYWVDSVYANKKIHSLLDKHLPKGSDYKALEVGCYPGSKLIYLKKHFGYSLYGVELIKKLALETMLNLKRVNIDGAIIHSDFFDKRFLEKYRSGFDILLDYGFSEHFSNFDDIIDNYAKLLKENGKVVIIIPNLLGIYQKFFSPAMLKRHNLAIMDKKIFESTANRKFKKLFCDYIGGFYTDSSAESNISLIIDNKFLRNFFLFIFKYLNKIMNYLPIVESRLFSPYLIYIGENTKAVLEL